MFINENINMYIEELTNSQIFVSLNNLRGHVTYQDPKSDSSFARLSFSIVFYTLCFTFLLSFWVEVVLGVASFYFVLTD